MFRFIAGTQEGYTYVLLYNFCAFAMQMPLGIIADNLNKNNVFAIIGLVLVATAFGLVQIPLIAVIVIGTGNAMLHIGGGIDVLNISEEKLSALGVFVSPGAFGIYFGTIMGKGESLIAFYFPVLLLASVIMIFVVYKFQKGSYPKNTAFSFGNMGSGKIDIRSSVSGSLGIKNKSFGKILVAAGCFFLVVCLRSYVGLALDFPWRHLGNWSVALVCAVVFGKVAGGFFADKFGVMKTTLLSLVPAASLLLLFHKPVAGVTALLLFNMTMPITLWAMVKLFPNAKGFSFGLLTFALFLGFLPVYLDVDVSAYSPLLFSVLTVASLGVLLFGLHKSGTENNDEKGNR